MREPPLFVTSYEPPHRFLVRSCSDPELQYLVDLQERDGRGLCSCEDAHFRPRKRECKHLRHVRALLEAAQQFCSSAGIPFDAALIGSSRRS